MIVNLKTIEIRSITLKRRALLGCARIDSWRAAIVLKKSFLADEPNFLVPPMRSTRGDVRDHIDLHKRNHEPSYWS